MLLQNDCHLTKLFPRGKLEMVLGYSEVKFGVKTQAGFCRNGAVFESKENLLLVERGGRFKHGIYTLYKLFGCGDVGRAVLVRRFAFTRHTLRSAVADSDDKHDFFAVIACFSA